MTGGISIRAWSKTASLLGQALLPCSKSRLLLGLLKLASQWHTPARWPRPGNREGGPCLDTATSPLLIAHCMGRAKEQGRRANNLHPADVCACNASSFLVRRPGHPQAWRAGQEGAQGLDRRATIHRRQRPIAWSSHSQREDTRGRRCPAIVATFSADRRRVPAGCGGLWRGWRVVCVVV